MGQKKHKGLATATKSCSAPATMNEHFLLLRGIILHHKGEVDDVYASCGNICGEKYTTSFTSLSVWNPLIARDSITTHGSSTLNAAKVFLRRPWSILPCSPTM